jgi:hypothetical protein
MVTTSSCPGLSRLRGRGRFGEAKARTSTFLMPHGVDGQDKPGHDGGENMPYAAFPLASWIARHTRSGVSGMSMCLMP